MTATEELRRMLDEKGIKWRGRHVKWITAAHKRGDVDSIYDATEWSLYETAAGRACRRWVFRYEDHADGDGRRNRLTITAFENGCQPADVIDEIDSMRYGEDSYSSLRC